MIPFRLCHWRSKNPQTLFFFWWFALSQVRECIVSDGFIVLFSRNEFLFLSFRTRFFCPKVHHGRDFGWDMQFNADNDSEMFFHFDTMVDVIINDLRFLFFPSNDDSSKQEHNVCQYGSHLTGPGCKNNKRCRFGNDSLTWCGGELFDLYFGDLRQKSRHWKRKNRMNM